jgi:uncharacterized protein (DUF2141 family)
MKKLAFAIAALALIALTAWDANAQSPAAAHCPTLNVSGLKPDEGVLMIAIYTSNESFFKQPAWVTAQKVSGVAMQIPVCNLDADEIAVTAFQDLNGNKKLDTNLIGIPNEPYAASGAPPIFSAPKWVDAKVAYKSATAPIAVKF